MSGQESREEQARRLLDEAIAENFRPFRRRGGTVRVVVEDTEHGREVDVDDGTEGVRVVYVPPGRR